MSWAEEVLARREVWQRAPSAHNTQPWVVAPHGEDLLLGWDEARHLGVGDPTRRDLMLSLGAVAEAIRIVAADHGNRIETSWDVHTQHRTAAVLRKVAGDPIREWRVVELGERQTARSAYREPWVTPTQVAELAEEARLPDRLRLQVVDSTWVERWLPVADRWGLEGPAAAELAGWLRLSRRHPRHDQDGLSAEAMGLSAAEAAGLRVALTAPARWLLARTGAMRLVAAQATSRPLGTVLALTGPPEPSLEAMGGAGMALLRLWLTARRHGWSAHPLSALLDCPASAAAWPGQGSPYAVFRLGHPASPAPGSARLG